MFYCPFCGKSLKTEDRFCDRCGKSVEAEAIHARAAEEQAFLDQTHRILKYERTALRIVGILFLVFSGIFLLFCGLTVAGLSALVFDPDTLAQVAAFGSGLAALLLFLCALTLLPAGVVNLVAAAKITPLMQGLYPDVRPTEKHCQSVGWVLLELFFNPFALILLVINFIRFKSEKATVKRIIQNQQTANQ